MSWVSRAFRALRSVPEPVKRLLPRSLKDGVRRMLGLQAGNGWFFYIDVVGACTLRCPSCPVGNSENVTPNGAMTADTYRAVLEKILREYRPNQISLFNWTEPLLHPDLASLIRITNEARVPCLLSSNLNVMPRIESVMAAEPEELRISLSGFSQEVYCQTHAGGKIEKVKQNMARLADIRRETKSRTRITVYYHKYRHNMHEVAPMRAYAESLGFDWQECWAVYMPVEGALAYLKGTLAVEHRTFIEKYLAVPLKFASDEAARYRSHPCRQLEEVVALDHTGQVQLCCGVFDTRQYGVGNFLETPRAAIDKSRATHPGCTPCMDAGLHMYYHYYHHPELRPLFDRTAEENTRPR